MEKAFIIRFVRVTSEPRKFQSTDVNKATIDAHEGMILFVPPCLIFGYRGIGMFIYHIGVRSRVARSSVLGNPRASKCGTSDDTDSHAFCF